MWGCLSSLAHAVLVQPFYNVYLHGPSWVGWKSRPPADICSQLTQVDAAFWAGHPVECEDLIQKDFRSFFSVLQLAAFLYTFFYVFHLLALRFLVYRPFYASAKELLASVNAASTRSHSLGRCRRRSSPRLKIESAERPT